MFSLLNTHFSTSFFSCLEQIIYSQYTFDHTSYFSLFKEDYITSGLYIDHNAANIPPKLIMLCFHHFLTMHGYGYMIEETNLILFQKFKFIFCESEEEMDLTFLCRWASL